MFRWIKRTRRSLRDWLKDRRRYLRYQWHRSVSAVFVWWESLKTSHEDSAPPVESGGRKFQRPRLKFSNFLNPFFWVSNSFYFMLRYLFSRRPIDVVLSLPGLAGMTGMFFVLYAYTPTEADLVERCRTRIQAFGSGQQFEQAVWYAKLWQSIQPFEPIAFVAESDLLRQEGKSQQARAILEQLFSRTQYEPALLRLCRDDLQLAAAGQLPAEAERNLAERLAWLDDRLVKDSEVQFLVGTFHMDRGDFAAARVCFQNAGENKSEYQVSSYLSQSICELRLKMRAASQSTASFGADLGLQQLVAFDTRPESLKTCCQLLVLSLREGEAVSLLEGRLARAQESESEPLRFLLAEVLTRWCERRRVAGFRSPQDLAECLQLLARAVAAFPRNEGALNELAWLANTNPDSPEIDALLNQILDSGIDPGFVHFVLGTRAAIKDPPDQLQAEEHLSLAVAHNANYPGLLNNLADVIARSESADDEHLKTALALAEQAVSRLATVPEVYDTRGRIRLRLGDLNGAITDFETAIRSPACRVSSYEGLSIAYEKLGNVGRAEHYRKLRQGLILSNQSEVQ